MNRTCKKCFLLVFIVCLSAFPSIRAWAEDQDLTYSISYTDQELDNLLGPIALYEDPMLAQMLPAATYPTEVADAAAWLNSGGALSRIDEQIWAESVRAMAHYPNVLQMMAESMDWTANLGDAFLNQPEDVANAIQRLRWRARAQGNLVSNAEQSVIVDGDYIQIVPAQPQYIYVPQYDPSAVYVQTWPFITFGYGLVIGDWLSMDFDWGRHQVIYHGWDRPGWVHRARPYVHIRNVYIDRSRPLINQTWRHDRSHGDPARYLASRPSGPNADRYVRMGEARGDTRPTGPAGAISVQRGDTTRIYSNRGRESRGVVNQQSAPLTPDVMRRPTVPTPNVSQRPATPSPEISERRAMPTPDISQRPATPPPGISERRSMPTPDVSQRPAPVPQVGSSSNQPSSTRASERPARTPSVTFGGYRGEGEARTQSLRGQDSRQSTEKARPSAPPVSRGGAPAGRDASGDRQRR